MLSDFVEPKWQRPRGIRRVHLVAVLAALAAVGVVLVMFNKFGIVQLSTADERLLIAAVDLRIGNPAGAAERGEARARADIEAGLLQLQVFGAKPAATQARRLKKDYGFAWVHKGKEATPLTQAFADGYNRVMRAEIERRHGRAFVDELLKPAPPPPTR